MITVVEVELTDYRVPVFRRLQERLGERVVVFHGPAAPGSGLSTVAAGDDVGFEHEILSGSWLANGRLNLTNPLPAVLQKPRAAIVRHSVRNPTFFPMVKTFQARGVPVVGWGQGFSRRRPFRPSRRLGDRLHLAVVRTCDAYVCYTESTRQSLERFVTAQDLFVARNTLDTDRLIALRRHFDARGRAAIRQELGLDAAATHLCYIGRLQERKRPGVLVEACAKLREEMSLPCRAIFVGDGPQRASLERRVSELGLGGDVVFTGALYGDEAARYLYAADVMAMPGWLGLAVVHAFALGVPVVSQLADDGLVGHPPEAEYVVDGVNGRMADAGGVPEFAAAVQHVLEQRETLARGAAEFAEENLTLDRMIDGFVAAIEHVTVA